MIKKINYYSEDERNSILEENKDMYLIEHAELYNEKYLIFSDSPPIEVLQKEQGEKISILQAENSALLESQKVQNRTIVENDMRMMDLEWALEDLITSINPTAKINLMEVFSMFGRSATYFNQLKQIIEMENYDSKEDMERILNKYATGSRPRITQEEYDLLSQIAPVVAYPKNAWQTLWREQITMDATAMGKQAEGEKLVKDLDALIKEKTANYTDLKGKTAVFCYFNPADLGKFYIYLPTDPRAAYLTDLGLSFPESISKLGADSFSIEISAENIDVLKDADILVAYGNDDLLKALQSDALLGTVPAVKNGAVALIEDGSVLSASCTPSALSIPATIDEYLEILGAAASKVK